MFDNHEGLKKYNGWHVWKSYEFNNGLSMDIKFDRTWDYLVKINLINLISKINNVLWNLYDVMISYNTYIERIPHGYYG